MANIAESVRYAYAAAARFEMSESEALAQVASHTRAYERAFAQLPATAQKWADERVPALVPAFRDLWRGNMRYGNGGAGCYW